MPTIGPSQILMKLRIGRENMSNWSEPNPVLVNYWKKKIILLLAQIAKIDPR